MKRQIHIQHVLLSLQPGGLENGVINVVNRLDRERFRSSVCCLKQAGAFATRLQGGEVIVHQMGSRGGIDARMPFRLARLFRQTNTDIVHTRNAEAFFYGLLGARLAGVRRVIHSEHGRTFTDRKLRFWTQSVLSRFTDAIFTVSEQLKLDLVSHVGIPATRIEVICNGVDVGQFAPAQRDRSRSALGLGPDDLVVGSVGRIVVVKNYALLLRAVHALGINRAIVLLAGDGPERASLELLARTLGLGERVRFLGHRDDVSRIVEAMDVFVLPSISEGMSNTLLEAMAAGVAVVASIVGGNPEIVRDEIDGLLFKSNDQDALRDRLRRLLTDPVLRARLGQSGRERVIRDFSLEAMITRYEALYHSVFVGHAVRSR